MSRWYTVDLRRRLRLVARRPVYAMSVLLRQAVVADERFLARLAAVPVSQIRAYVNEPLQQLRFMQHLRDSVQEAGDHMGGAEPYARKTLLQYAAVRALEPTTVVETGVANGISSALFCLALAQAGKNGRLFSIDLGDRAPLPKEKEVGWAVPDWLRARWHLRLGDAAQELPRVLGELGQIDVFVHDSLHTFDHMMFEFETAYQYLRPGGLLISDDVLWNEAFDRFSASVGPLVAGILHGVGFLRKP